jgi:hypothetical protein
VHKVIPRKPPGRLPGSKELSGSMADKVAKVHEAVKAFLDNLEPEDEEFLLTLLINRSFG